MTNFTYGRKSDENSRRNSDNSVFTTGCSYFCQ